MSLGQPVSAALETGHACLFFQLPSLGTLALDEDLRAFPEVHAQAAESPDRVQPQVYIQNCRYTECRLKKPLSVPETGFRISERNRNASCSPWALQDRSGELGIQHEGLSSPSVLCPF